MSPTEQATNNVANIVKFADIVQRMEEHLKSLTDQQKIDMMVTLFHHISPASHKELFNSLFEFLRSEQLCKIGDIAFLKMEYKDECN